MTYKTLAYIHSLLAQEERARKEKMEKARDVFERTSCEDENCESVEAFYNFSRESFFEVKSALEDFVNADWHC